MPSHVIRAFSYEPAENRLDVRFTSGRAYSYYDVAAAVFEAMARAFAKGEYFNRHVRGRYRFSRRTHLAGSSPHRG